MFGWPTLEFTDFHQSSPILIQRQFSPSSGSPLKIKGIDQSICPSVRPSSTPQKYVFLKMIQSQPNLNHTLTYDSLTRFMKIKVISPFISPSVTPKDFSAYYTLAPTILHQSSQNLAHRQPNTRSRNQNILKVFGPSVHQLVGPSSIPSKHRTKTNYPIITKF